MSVSQSIRIVLIVLAVGVALYLFKPVAFNKQSNSLTRVDAVKHIIDKAGVIAAGDLPRFEQYMNWIMVESGIDVRFIFVPDSGGESIEQLAVDLMDQLHIGRDTGKERGLLLLYDIQGQHLKIEVGYGLEGWFTDAFVNYLIENHARMFFSSGNLSWGLRQLLRLLQHRIREAIIGNDFDPRILEKIQTLAHFSGGAGVSTTTDLGNGRNNLPEARSVDTLLFPSGTTPEEAYNSYINWLTDWPVNPNTDFLTKESRNYLTRFQASPAYAAFILMGEYGKHFTVLERDNVALLFFTDTPFVSPHFFVRENGRWRMDLIAEVQNTHEHVGGPLTWSYTGKSDKYTQAFKDLLVRQKGYVRFRDGDNRILPIHGNNP